MINGVEFIILRDKINDVYNRTKIEYHKKRISCGVI